MTSPVVIQPYLSLKPDVRLRDGLDAVFFQSSNKKSFASDQEKRAFRERWLGRYLEHDPQFVFVAVATDGTIAGYIAGSIDDPALTPRFQDIGYFSVFKDLTRAFPAHLHVNLAPRYRGQKTGGLLVETFTAAVARAGAPGVHVVTGRGARNVSFYNRQGFYEQAATGDGGEAVVFLARRLGYS